MCFLKYLQITHPFVCYELQACALRLCFVIWSSQIGALAPASSFVDTIGLLAAPSLAKATARRFCAPSSVYDVLLSAEAQVHSGGISGDEVVRRILIF